jgi:hypothetical protein
MSTEEPILYKTIKRAIPDYLEILLKEGNAQGREIIAKAR